jgi:hypothetical protein
MLSQPLKATMAANDIFEAVSEFSDTNDLQWEKLLACALMVLQ